MTGPKYKPGQRVLVTGEVTAVETGRPFGTVTVRFAEATDPSHLLDGVDAVLPQVCVYALDQDDDEGVDVPEWYIDGYLAQEGHYPDD